MRARKVVHIVGCHAGGEIGEVIVGGIAPPPGDTVYEQSRHVHRDGTLRNFVLNEPRGGVFKHVNLLVPAKSPGADMGFIIMEPMDTPLMSGSNAMCVATVLLDTGILPMVEPITKITLEAPGGLVQVTAYCRNGKAEKMEVRNLPSYVDRFDAQIEVAGLGTITVDTAWGGDSFVIIDGSALGFDVTPDEARDIAEAGSRITAAANEQIGFMHPENGWDHLSFCQFTRPAVRTDEGVLGVGTVALQPGKLDRSPSGTGSSARMALLRARGELRLGESYIGQSILGTRFHGRIVEEIDFHGRTAIRPIISGQAWIHGVQQHVLDPDDPFPAGYRLSDTWPMFK